MALVHKVLCNTLHKTHHENQKMHYTKQKNETDDNEKEIENLAISKIKECDETTQSTQDSCYSWSGISQEIGIKGEKRELSNDEEEPWLESFKSQSSQKSTQSTPTQEFHSLQASSQASSKAQASFSQDDNKSDDEEDKKDDEKIRFYLKLGKYKQFKYM